MWGWLVYGNHLCYASSSSWAHGQRHTFKQPTNPLDHTQTHRQVCGVCTCERILSAGPSFSPMVLSRCSSVSSGNVSPSMACSRNTWQRHSRFSHSPGTHTHLHIHSHNLQNSGSIPKCNIPICRGRADDYYSTFV